MHRSKLVFLTLLSSPFALADEPAVENLTVHGARIFTEPGSTTVIGSEQLETYKYTDLNRILKTVPGVQVQEEDGFGLRPNIGMRGVAPHRSRKILIMEDGIPSGPAPYAAPAAYHVPTMTTIDGIEVTKGPSAVRYGPQTIGGAINLLTRKIPEEPLSARLELANGTFNYRKAQAEIGGKTGDWGWSLLGAQIGSDGFKTLANGGDTGFHKRDLMGKLTYDLNSNQQLFFKGGWSDELSDESYLGITRDDFEQDPYQRYTASERDQMKNGHRSFAVGHAFKTEAITSRLTLYENTFDRLWARFDGMSDRNIDIRSVLDDPKGGNQHIFEVLKGLDDSLGDTDKVLLANNHRTYYSRGINWDGRYNTSLGETQSNQLEWGLRLHQDSIQHDHTTDTFDMISGHLLPSGDLTQAAAQDRISAEAWSTYLWDTYSVGAWRLSAGLRQEWVDIKQNDYSAANLDSRNSRTATMPGAGLFYQITPQLGWLLGVYRGMGLAAADDDGSGKAEQSINYESGFRYLEGSNAIDLIGYWNDYSNIKGTCSVAEGCGTASRDVSYDGGKAQVYGVEFNATHTFRIGSVYFPNSVQYTLTHASFDGDFTSGLSDWGIGAIKKGDPIPYIPRDQIGIQSAVRWDLLLFSLQWKYQSASYDQALLAGREEVPSSTLLDASLSAFATENLEIYATGDNVTDQKNLTSFRPLGARPGKPQAYVFGVKAKM